MVRYGLFGGALCLFGYRTFDAVVRQRSFSAALLPGAGLTATVVVPLLLRRPSPTAQQLLDRLQKGEELPSDLSQEMAQTLIQMGTEQPENGTPPILGWSPTSLDQLLKFEISLPQEIQNQLFLKYLKVHPWSIPKFLERCPDAIEGSRDAKELSLLKISIEPLKAIVKAMKAKGIDFSKAEVWLPRAVDGTTEIHPREFIALPYETRKKILDHIPRGEFKDRLTSIHDEFGALVSDLNSQRRSYHSVQSETLHQMMAREEAWVRSCFALTGTSYPAAQWSWATLHSLNPYLEIPLPFQQTILDLFVRKNDDGALKSLLETWPSAIQRVEERHPRFLMREALNLFRTKERVQQLVNVMRAEGEEPNPWVARAVEDQADFEATEFEKLTSAEKNNIYWIANKLKARHLVARLNELGMQRPNPDPFPLAPMLNPDMDLVTAGGVVTSYLRSLRERGLLLKSSEFTGTGYIRKSHCLERILGADRIRAVANRHRCRSIFTPKKVAVIDDGCSELKVSVKLDEGGFPSKYMGCPLEEQGKGEYPLAIYAERIQADQSRNMEVDSVIELATVLWHSGFTDFKDGNIFRTERGFYFIDTEFISFSFRWSPEVRRSEITEYVRKLVKREDLEPLNQRLDKVFATPPDQSIFDHTKRTERSAPLLNSFGSVTIPMEAIFEPSSAPPPPSSSSS